MSREEIEKLLGGYATDTLDAAERRALYEAALEDQELFDALAKEQALREVLQDPPARQQLIQALGPARDSLAAGAWRWLRRPALLAGGLAAVLIAAGLVLLLQPKPAARREAIMARAIAPAPEAAPPASGAAPVRVFRAPAATRKPQRLMRPSEPPTLSSSNEVQAPELALPAPTATAALPASSTPSAPLPSAAQRPVTVGLLSGRAMLPMAKVKQAKAAAGVAGNPSLSYSLLLEGANGAYLPAAPDAVFHPGDSVRIQAEPNDTGYIYLFQKNAAGAWNTVAGLPAEKGQRYVLPSSGGLESDQPAQLELLLLFSRREQATLQTADLDSLAATAQPQTAFRIVLEFR